MSEILYSTQVWYSVDQVADDHDWSDAKRDTTIADMLNEQDAFSFGGRTYCSGRNLLAYMSSHPDAAAAVSTDDD